MNIIFSFMLFQRIVGKIKTVIVSKDLKTLTKIVFATVHKKHVDHRNILETLVEIGRIKQHYLGMILFK